jgi:catechol-2,3-dioxygenase
MLGVSEIGLSVPQIKPVYEQLHKQLNLNMWRRSLEQFAAVGDEKDLIILVTRERGFVLLGKQDKVEIFPLQMTIKVEREAGFNLNGTPYVITFPTTSKNHHLVI